MNQKFINKNIINKSLVSIFSLLFVFNTANALNLGFLDKLSLRAYCAVQGVVGNTSGTCTILQEEIAKEVAAEEAQKQAQALQTNNKSSSVNTSVSSINQTQSSQPPINNAGTSPIVNNGQPIIQTIYNVIERAVPGPKGEKGEKGDTIYVNNNNLSGLQNGSFGGYVNPTPSTNYVAPIGISTLGYIKEAKVENSTFENSKVNNSTFENSKINNTVFEGSNVFNSDIVVNNANVNVTGNLQAESGLFSQLALQSGTSSYFFSATSASNNSNSINLTTQNALITNSTTSNASIDNAVITNATIDNYTTNNATINNANVNLLNSNNALINNATSTNLFVNVLKAVSGAFDSLVATLASISNLSFGTAIGTNITATGTATLANANITNAIVTNSTTTNANITAANITNSTTTNAILTNSTTTNGVFTNATITNLNNQNSNINNATINNVNITNSTTTNAAAVNLVVDNASITNTFTDNLSAVNSTLTNANINSLSSINSTNTNATSSNFFTNILRATTSFFSSLTATFANIATLNFDNIIGGNITATGTATINNINSNTLNIASNATLGTTTINSPLFLQNIESGIATNSLLIRDNIGQIRIVSPQSVLASNTVNVLGYFVNSGNAIVSNVNGNISTTTIDSLSNIVLSGTTTAIGNIQMNNNRIIGLGYPIFNNDAANKEYVDTFVQGLTWQGPALAFAATTSPVSPALNDKYVLRPGASGFGSCAINDIVTWSGAAWTCNTPATSTTMNISNEGLSYTFNGAGWVSLGNFIQHNALIQKQGGDGVDYYHLGKAQYEALTASTSQIAELLKVGNPAFNSLSASSSTIDNATSTNIFSSNIFVTALRSISAIFDNLTATLANITNLQSNNANLTNATLVNATTSNEVVGNSVITNSTTTNGVITNATLTNVSINNANFTNSTTTNAILTNSTTTNAVLTNSTTSNANIDNLFANTISANSLLVTNSSLTNANISNAIVANSTITNSSLANSTTTNGVITNANLTNGVIGNSTTTNAILINATSSNFFVTLLQGLDAVLNNITAILANINSLNFGSATGTNITATGTATLTNANITNSTTTNGTITNATINNANILNSSSSNIFSTSSLFISATASNLFANNLSATSLSSAGLTLSSTTPATTTNTLYNQSGTLYWNGQQVGGGGGSLNWLASNITATTSTVGLAPATSSASTTGLSVDSAGNMGLYNVGKLSAYFGINGSVGIGNNITPNSDAILDLSSSNKGLLLPRVALVHSASSSPFSAHVAGMMVYNTATAGDLTPGVYTNSGVLWESMRSSGGSGSAGSIPSVTTAVAVASTTSSTSFTSGGTIISNGGAAIAASGVVWDTNPNPTISLITKTNNTVLSGSFSSFVSGLSLNTTYYLRAYATNSNGTAYGETRVFTSSNIIFSSVTTVTNVAAVSATFSNNIVNDGGTAISETGFVWNTTGNPDINDTGKISVATSSYLNTKAITGLATNTTYFIRAYAKNVNNNIGYGPQFSFTTGRLGIVTTAETYPFGGTIVDAGGLSVLESGIVYSTVSGPTISNATKISTTTVQTGFFKVNFTLSSTSTNYMRAYITNAAGTTYGNQIILQLGTSTTINYTGTIVNYTPPSGLLAIEVYGAQGGSNGSTVGGKGAFMKAEFNFSSSSIPVFSILVGQQPPSSSLPGGGGGTFVALGSGYATATPLIVAGGGGGVFSGAGYDGRSSELGGGPYSVSAGYGANQAVCGGGGGGFYSSGSSDSSYPSSGVGGAGFRQGGAGGVSNFFGPGGFGGGATADAAGSCYLYGGPGGGYSGGSGLSGSQNITAGNGGGSYISPAGSNQIKTDGGATGGGHGKVIIYPYTILADLAEEYPSKDTTLIPGEILALDKDNAVFVKRAAIGDRLIGIYSTNPHTIMGQGGYPDEFNVPVALSGRVPTKVNNENGPIAIGDRITISSTPGVGMKADPWDEAVGYALDNYNGEGVGSIQVFIQLDNGYMFDGNSGLSAMALFGTSTGLTRDNLFATSTDLTVSLASAGTYIKSKMTEGTAVLREFLSAKITAIAGYFDNLFVHKLCLEKSDGTRVCITGDEFQDLLIKNNITALSDELLFTTSTQLYTGSILDNTNSGVDNTSGGSTDNAAASSTDSTASTNSTTNTDSTASTDSTTSTDSTATTTSTDSTVTTTSTDSTATTDGSSVSTTDSGSLTDPSIVEDGAPLPSAGEAVSSQDTTPPVTDIIEEAPVSAPAS